MIALIPARSGSKRVKHKNVRMLAGVPLMAWTISVARKSGLFTKVLVSTDNVDYARIADSWDAEVVFRPAEMATDKATDFEWIQHALEHSPARSFALLRPTSPFRTVEELKRAYRLFHECEADSIRAVQPVHEHPYKMWVEKGDRIVQLFPLWDINVMQTQSMPAVYWANSSLEMAWSRVVEAGTYSGYDIAPFYTNWLEAFDIHGEDDFLRAEEIVKQGLVEVPK